MTAPRQFLLSLYNRCATCDGSGWYTDEDQIEYYLYDTARRAKTVRCPSCRGKGLYPV
jgi:DnaJ-class molecular chaperone